jgi:hypothetical protein
LNTFTPSDTSLSLSLSLSLPVAEDGAFLGDTKIIRENVSFTGLMKEKEKEKE